MKSPADTSVFALIVCLFASLGTGHAGTWKDPFAQAGLASDWAGNREFFRITEGILEGNSGSPVGPSPLNFVELAVDSAECTVSCWMNVVSPNLRVCTKGALVLRHTGADGYVFALHEATQTAEVYRLKSGEILLKKAVTIQLKTWYHIRAELQQSAMKFFIDGQLVGTVVDALYPNGSVGLAVQDAEPVRFDDFTISGPKIVGEVDMVPISDLRIVPKEANPEIMFRFQAIPPFDYFVQASALPFSHEWQTIKSVRAKIQTVDVEVTESLTDGVRFFRIDKVPCLCR